MVKQRVARTLSDIGIGTFLSGVVISAGTPLVGEAGAMVAITSGLAALLVSQSIAHWLASGMDPLGLAAHSSSEDRSLN